MGLLKLLAVPNVPLPRIGAAARLAASEALDAMAGGRLSVSRALEAARHAVPEEAAPELLRRLRQIADPRFSERPGNLASAEAVDEWQARVAAGYTAYGEYKRLAGHAPNSWACCESWA